MKIERMEKPSFSVMGMEGSTMEGEGFIQRLWERANARYGEIAAFAKPGPGGAPLALWGAMTDFSRSFRPWEDGFTKGLYLAGVECMDDALPPDGWTKWRIPGYVYLKAELDGTNVFGAMLDYIRENKLTLAGAVHDMTDPASGKSYMIFPIEKTE